ncbi:Uncharacterised protein [Chlamydia abortus]|nr:Uncharacterised protein [Chlamydia abortus]
MNPCEPNEVQQGQGVARGPGQSQVLYRLGKDPLESSPVGEVLGGPGGQEARREPAVYACKLESQLCSGLH